MFIIITGNITAGFEFTGPFKTMQTARRYAEAHRDLIADYEIVELNREYTNC